MKTERLIIEFVLLGLVLGLGMMVGAMFNESSNRDTLVTKGFAEYRINPLTGETKFVIFKIKDGQLVKE